MKNELRIFLEKIPESLSAYIDRYNILMTNDELIDLIINSNNWIIYIFYEYYNQITIINIMFDVKFIHEYSKYYDELCKSEVKDNTNNVMYINQKYCTIYDELCKIAIKDRSYYIKFIKPEYCTIYDNICKIVH